MTLSLSLDALGGLYSALAGQAEGGAIAVDECLFHTVEALVDVEEEAGVDPMALFVLRAFEFALPADVEHLDGILHIGRQVLRQVLSGMAVNGLIAAESESIYRLTDRGRSTLRTGRVIRRVPARRIFHFLHPSMCYIAIHDSRGNVLSDLSPSRTPPGWEFNPVALRQAIEQSDDWKRRHQFPGGIVDVITSPIAPSTPESSQAQAKLQHLVVDKAQVVSCAIVFRQVGTDDVDLRGYPVSVHGNLIPSKGKPLFSMQDRSAVETTFPSLLTPPTSDEVNEGWLELATRLGLHTAEQGQARFEDGLLVIALSADHFDRWMPFVMLALNDQLIWQVPRGSLLQLCKVDIEGADSERAVD